MTAEMDRFAHLLIYTALRLSAAGGKELWDRHDTLENMLFREEDFRRPRPSRLLRELWSLTDADARDLVGQLVLASQGPLLVVPSLDELVDEKIVRPLTGSEETQVNALLGEAEARPRRSRVVAPGRRRPYRAPAIEIDSSPVAVLLAAPAGCRCRSRGAGRTCAADDAGAAARRRRRLPRSARPSSSEVALETEAAEKALDVTTLLDPVVSILSRPGWMAALGLSPWSAFYWSTCSCGSSSDLRRHLLRRPHGQRTSIPSRK